MVFINRPTSRSSQDPGSRSLPSRAGLAHGEVLVLIVVCHTYLCPNHLSQCPNELWSSINSKFESFLIDNFANGEPQRSLETLCCSELKFPEAKFRSHSGRYLFQSFTIILRHIAQIGVQKLWLVDFKGISLRS